MKSKDKRERTMRFLNKNNKWSKWGARIPDTCLAVEIRETLTLKEVKKYFPDYI